MQQILPIHPVLRTRADDEQLNVLLNKPRAFVQATKMSFVGLKDAQERADVIAYLHTLSDSPIPLPTAK
jgi:cytochrome c